MIKEFKKNKYLIVKNVLTNECLNLIDKYFLLKKEAVRNMYLCNLVKPNGILGSWYDGQVNNTYAIFGDFLSETILQEKLKLVEKKTGLKLLPSYSYMRIYKKGDTLTKHTDRNECEISTTLNISGNQWPIYFKINNKKIKITLKPGEMVIYKGTELEHWREKFKGKKCIQIFLHYVNAQGPYKNNIFDKRPCLGFIDTTSDYTKNENNKLSN